MNLENVIIVLSHPEESRNVGSVCRAMANCAIKSLRIVGKRGDYDDGKVRALSVHATKIWENAQFFSSITEATNDCTLCAGTTRRRGKKRGRLLLPEEFADFASPISDGGKIAIAFGNERTGLTEDELFECTTGITIPSSDDFPSLNLSHAVQIISYTLFRASAHTSKSEIVTLQRLDAAIQKISQNLKTVGFFSLSDGTELERFFRAILSRSALTEGECSYVERIFDKIAGLSKKRDSSL